MKRVFIVSLFVCMMLIAGVAYSKSIYVDDDNTEGPWDGTPEHPYQHIQDGIDAAESGDTVSVAAGTYSENVSITFLQLILQGAGAHITTIAGSVDIRGHMDLEVKVSGFTIREVLAWGDGGTITIINNIITGSSSYGLTIGDTAERLDVYAEGNLITGNAGGVLVDGGFWGSVNVSPRNTIYGNTGYEIYNGFYEEVSAVMNYWGPGTEVSGPDPGEFIGPVNYTPWLTEDQSLPVKLSYIAFVANGNVWIINEDGTGLINLNQEATACSLSEDGSKIVFVNGGAIWVMNSDRSGLVKLGGENVLYRGSGIDYTDPRNSPSFSPDGRRVAYTSDGNILENPEDNEIHIMDASNGEIIKKYPASGSYHPTWAPDGQKIAFIHDKPGMDEGFNDYIGVLDVTDGSISDLVLLYEGSDWVRYGIDWSPDGSKIVFSDGWDMGGFWDSCFDADVGIYVTPIQNPLATHINTPIAPGCWGEYSAYPVWSPDGTKMAFIRYTHAETESEPHSYYGDIWVMDADGANPLQITSFSDSMKISSLSWALKPSYKHGDVSSNGAVSAYDATLVLQATVGLIQLTPEQESAADVSCNGEVTAYDASLILQYVVGLIDKFTACGAAPYAKQSNRRYTVSIANISAKPGERVTVPVNINDAAGIFSGEIVIDYDSAFLKPVDVMASSLTSEYSMEHNARAGQLFVSFASEKSLDGSGSLFNLGFEAINGTADKSNTELTLQKVRLSEELHVVKINGSVTLLLAQTALLQNYPNPFNPETWLPYQLAKDASVTIRIYNVKGRLIRTLDLGNKNAGVYMTKDKAAHWDGKDSLGQSVASGMYFYTLRVEHPDRDGAGIFTTTRKMVIVK